MKRIIVLLVVALMSSMMLNAKNVRGFVSDKDGNPVAGVKMVVPMTGQPGQTIVMTETDADGFFSVKLPDGVDALNPHKVFARTDMSVERYWVTPTGQIRIVVNTDRK